MKYRINENIFYRLEENFRSGKTIVFHLKHKQIIVLPRLANDFFNFLVKPQSKEAIERYFKDFIKLKLLSDDYFNKFMFFIEDLIKVDVIKSEMVYE